MSVAFLRKLETYTVLSEQDREVVRSVVGDASVLQKNCDIVREGEEPTSVKLISKGFAYRYKDIEGGRRQIVGYLFPGDICDLHVTALNAMDHSIATVSPVTLVKISKGSIERLLARPALAHALILVSLTNEAIARDWLANIGQRRGEARLAHLLCEWRLRLKSVGLVSEYECEFPLNQSELGDTVGLSTVHVNRSLKSLSERGLAFLKKGKLRTPDFTALMKVGGFHHDYLHQLDQRSSHKPA